MLEDPGTYQDVGKAVSVNRELQHVVDDLARVNAEWEAEAGKLPAPEHPQP